MENASKTKQTSFLGTKSVGEFVAAASAAGESLELNLVRRSAAKRFATQNWPTNKDEEWRRTRVEAFEFDSLAFALAGCAPGGLSASAIEARCTSFLAKPADIFGTETAAKIAGNELASMVAVTTAGDGSLGIDIQSSSTLTKSGVVVGNLSGLSAACASSVGVPFAHTINQKAAGILAAAYERAEAVNDNRFISWNLAAWNAGIVVYVPRNAIVEAPVVIDWLLEGEDRVFQPLLLVVAEEGAQIQIIQRFHGEGGWLCNAAQYVQAGENATVKLFTLQESGSEGVIINNGHASVARSATFKHAEAQLGGGFVKTRYSTDLNDSGADVHLDGLYFGEDAQHFDLRTVQNHNAARASSRAFYKGVVRDKARSIYQGLILVAPQAAGTDAFLTNRNLVLNDGARADSIPTLEIRTNDVKCSHGSTTGKIDPEEVFYLENRGLSKAEAEKLIIIAYLDEVTTGMPALVQDHIRGMVETRITRKV